MCSITVFIMANKKTWELGLLSSVYYNAINVFASQEDIRVSFCIFPVVKGNLVDKQRLPKIAQI